MKEKEEEEEEQGRWSLTSAINPFTRAPGGEGGGGYARILTAPALLLPHLLATSSNRERAPERLVKRTCIHARIHASMRSPSHSRALLRPNARAASA